ncbi:MAG: nicotinate-nucleotide--dimethylbenzimidazole phosphoribosyltransferase [Hyphomicrobiaceae bacterium]|nr:nicotinate-nucleotide--dimethylbenzimidazole phosphoribosyltransferase [Hyphomicrobiaceae bacterium]
MPLFSSPEDLTRILRDLPSRAPIYAIRAGHRQRDLVKPPGSLGRLEDIAQFLASWSNDGTPRAHVVRGLIFAGTHGVTAQGISPYPSSVTMQMVETYRRGGAAINVLARLEKIDLDIVPLQLEHPTGDISLGPAMTMDETLDALNAGADAVKVPTDLLILGEMGIGNTTIAAALAARAFDGDGNEWAGAGTGLDTDGIRRKAAVINRALDLHRAAPKTAFAALQRLGGREQAALAGAIVKARLESIPVVLDGFVVGATLATLYSEVPDIITHCLAGHLSDEQAHVKLLRRMRLSPLLDLGMRLGEGSGAALATNVIRAAVHLHMEMATFSEAGVTNRDDA